MTEASLLYLDYARFGGTSSKALATQREFVRQANERLVDPYFTQFLVRPSESRLRSWDGVPELKRQLASLAGFPEVSNVLLASRTQALVRFAGHALAATSRRVLITDLGWSPWQEIIASQASESGLQLTRLELRTSVLSGQLSVGDVTSRIAEAIARHCCDSLFLPLVSSDGVRLPVRGIVQEARTVAHLRLCVVDGSQTVGHVPGSLAADDCDIFLAGCHKWIRSGSPLGVAVMPRTVTRTELLELAVRSIQARIIDDPLLSFLNELDSGSLERHAETVNLVPLIAASGAVAEFASAGNIQRKMASRFHVQLENADRVAETARRCGWCPLRPERPMRTGILLLRPGREVGMVPDQIRQVLYQHGVAATVATNATVRLSMPVRQLTDEEVRTVRAAFEAVTSRRGWSAMTRTPAMPESYVASARRRHRVRRRGLNLPDPLLTGETLTGGV